MFLKKKHCFYNIDIFIIIMRRKLTKTEKKVTMAITINPLLYKIISEEYTNKSKHVEWLIYKDLLKNNKVKEMPL